MSNFFKTAFALMLLVLVSMPLTAQEFDDFESVPVHKNERAITFSLSTNGIALGGLYRFKLPGYMHFGVNLEFFAIRDDNEIPYYDPFVNQYYTLNDANRMFMIPLNFELKKRLFADDIEDNFRPHIVGQVGMAYGMNFPKEQYISTNGVVRQVDPESQYEMTYNILFGFGVDVTTRANFFVSVRPQYRYTFFQEEIAGKKDHSTFEIKFEIGGQR